MGFQIFVLTVIVITGFNLVVNRLDAVIEELKVRNERL